ncbi:MAG: asparagine--tRNA ligase, partial [Bacteroidales bacterium]|nr:asparagine--tRNA ligase [Bacteroidales bacterium]
MQRTVIIDALKSTAFNEPINVRGWVRSKRGNKQVSFIALNDGSTIKTIQIVADMSKFTEEQLKPVTTGSCISATGILVPSQGAGQAVEIQLTELEVYGTADPDQYPLQKKGLSMEYLRTIAH